MNTQAGQYGPMSVSDLRPPINPFIGLIPSDAWNKLKQYMAFSWNFTGANALAASSNGNLSINVDNTSDMVFMLPSALVTSTDDATAYAYWPILGQFALTAGSKVFSDAPIPLGNLAPPASTPKYFPYPMYVPANSTLTLTLTNLVATNFNVRVMCEGFRVFGQAAQ